ncbi:porin family protein [Myroides injenensis]|uniref:porin family protein n=1 Tax=Myroides injenensis TaxID=1183151 RepID=UPI0002889DE0|nr:porin family protein [Myroides injenensis]
MNKDWKEELRKKMEDFEVEAPQGMWEKLEDQLFSDHSKKVMPLVANSTRSSNKTIWIRIISGVAAAALLFVFVKPLLEKQSIDLDNELLPRINEIDVNSPIKVTQEEGLEKLENNNSREHINSKKEGSYSIVNSDNDISNKKNRQSTNNNSFIASISSSNLTSETIDGDIINNSDTKDIANADHNFKEELFDKELVEAELKQIEEELFAAENEKDSKVARKSRWIGGLNSGGTFTKDKQQFTGYGTISGKSLSYASLYMEEASGFKTTFNDIIRANMYQNAITDVKHKAPITASISVGYQLTDKWTVSSGLSYTKLSSELKSGTPSSRVLSEQDMHYLGIPLQISYKVIGSGNFSLYGAAGGLFEKSVSGEVKTRYVVDEKVIDSDKKNLNENTIQVSVNGGIGAEYMITKHLGFYVEPGVQYHIKNSSEIGTIYKEKPFSFNTKVGIRLLFAK